MRILKFFGLTLFAVVVGVFIGAGTFWLQHGRPSWASLLQDTTPDLAKAEQGKPSPSPTAQTASSSDFIEPLSGLTFKIPSESIMVEDTLANQPKGIEGKKLLLLQKAASNRYSTTNLTLYILTPSNPSSTGLTSSSSSTTSTTSTALSTSLNSAAQQLKRTVLANLQLVPDTTTSSKSSSTSSSSPSSWTQRLYANQYGYQDDIFEQKIDQTYILVHHQTSSTATEISEATLQQLLQTLRINKSSPSPTPSASASPPTNSSPSSSTTSPSSTSSVLLNPGNLSQ